MNDSFTLTASRSNKKATKNKEFKCQNFDKIKQHITREDDISCGHKS